MVIRRKVAAGENPSDERKQMSVRRMRLAEAEATSYWYPLKSVGNCCLT